MRWATFALGSSLLCCAAVGDRQRPSIQLKIDDATGGFELIFADRECWTTSSGPPRLHANGKWMQLEMSSEPVLSGNTKTIEWSAPSSKKAVLSTSFTTYPEDPSRVTFEQCILEDLSNTAVHPDVDTASEAILSAFPNFATSVDGTDRQRRGFLGYFDQMLGGMEGGTKWGQWGVDMMPSGPKAGPIVVFNEEHGTGAMAISPFSNFMGQSMVYNASAQALEFGLLGSITSVPAGLCSSVVVVGGWTPTEAVKALGSTLLTAYGKQGHQWNSDDVTISKVSYSTDHGAFYYYNAEPFKNEQEALETLLTSKEYPLPVSSVLLDSWWYYKGPKDGVTEWVATPEWFPHGGLEGFHSKVPMPIIAHNRFWSDRTVYARKNGGQYDFIVEKNRSKAIPMDQRFWDDLMINGTRWGLAVYEQDWLHNEWEGLDVTRTNATLAQTWLNQMGRAAIKAGIKIQYCMAYSRFALASVMIPAVDQIRVSDDYSTDLVRLRSYSANLYIGTSSLLAGALGLAPSKDVFWSTVAQPGAEAKYGNVTAPAPELHAAVSVLSAGPLAVGDRYGYTNMTLLAMTCMRDGTLLKPSWPAVPIDAYHVQRAFGHGGPQGELTYTYSELAVSASGKSRSVHAVSVLAMDLLEGYSLDMSVSLPELDKIAGAYFVYKMLTEAGKSDVGVVGPGSRLDLPACGKQDYLLYNIMPALEYPLLTLLGETGKFVPTSPKRFSSIVTVPDNGGSLVAIVNGSPGELIEVVYAQLAQTAGAKPRFATSSCSVPVGQSTCTLHASMGTSNSQLFV